MNDINNLPLLDNCPFCGSNSAKIEFSYAPYTKDDVKYMQSCGCDAVEGQLLGGCWVSCPCGAELGRGFQDTQEEDNGLFYSFQEASSAWNRRGVSF